MQSCVSYLPITVPKDTLVNLVKSIVKKRLRGSKQMSGWMKRRKIKRQMKGRRGGRETQLFLVLVTE